MEEIIQLDTRIVYRNKWFAVREDRIRRRSGREGIYGIIEKSDFAVIIPIENDHIYLVEQYRYPLKKRYMELPQGAFDGEGERTPLQVAEMELREETGLIAGKMRYVGAQFLAVGFSNQQYHVYVATELNQREPMLEAEEEGLVCKAVPIAAFEQMIRDGEVMDATTVNAYLLAKFRGII
ncbi:MAG: NUDIX hydrolase [Deltaproteobacteria bacterium]|nr:NUDIX hydrolase [Deltaproteobacteria bacterium]MBN2674808.1 NUDIX hydrolase [Deltaproteobacteria bacterium]